MPNQTVTCKVDQLLIWTILFKVMKRNLKIKIGQVIGNAGRIGKIKVS